jgi:hypothetical protein
VCHDANQDTVCKLSHHFHFAAKDTPCPPFML